MSLRANETSSEGRKYEEEKEEEIDGKKCKCARKDVKKKKQKWKRDGNGIGTFKNSIFFKLHPCKD